MSDLTPSLRTLVKLGSLVVHIEESMSDDGHLFDTIVIKGLLDDPDLVAWLDTMRASALLPVKRSP